MSVEDRLWERLKTLCTMMEVGTAFNSDVFELLATILAYYQIRGTEPEEMIGPPLKLTMQSIITLAEQEEHQ